MRVRNTSSKLKQRDEGARKFSNLTTQNVHRILEDMNNDSNYLIPFRNIRNIVKKNPFLTVSDSLSFNVIRNSKQTNSSYFTDPLENSSLSVYKPFYLRKRSEFTRDSFPLWNIPKKEGKQIETFLDYLFPSRDFDFDYVKAHELGFSNPENFDYFQHFFRIFIQKQAVLLKNHKSIINYLSFTIKREENKNDFKKSIGNNEKERIKYIPLTLKQFVLDINKLDVQLCDHLIKFHELIENSNANESSKCSKDIKNDIKNQSMQSGYFIEKPAENKNNNNIDLFNEEDFIQSIVNKASRKGISAISREDITKLQEISKRRREIIKNIKFCIKNSTKKSVGSIHNDKSIKTHEFSSVSFPAKKRDKENDKFKENMISSEKEIDPTTPKSQEVISVNKAVFTNLKKGITLGKLKNLDSNENEECNSIILKSAASEFYLQPNMSEFFENEENFTKMLIDKLEANKKIFQKIYEKSGIKQELSSYIFKIYEKLESKLKQKLETQNKNNEDERNTNEEKLLEKYNLPFNFLNKRKRLNFIKTSTRNIKKEEFLSTANTIVKTENSSLELHSFKDIFKNSQSSKLDKDNNLNQSDPPKKFDKDHSIVKTILKTTIEVTSDEVNERLNEENQNLKVEKNTKPYMFDHDKNAEPSFSKNAETPFSSNKNSDEPFSKTLETTRKSKKKIFFADHDHQDEFIENSINRVERWEGQKKKKEKHKIDTMINNSIFGDKEIVTKSVEGEVVPIEGNEKISEKNLINQNNLMKKIANKINSKLLVPASNEHKGKKQQYFINEPTNISQASMAGKKSFLQNASQSNLFQNSLLMSNSKPKSSIVVSAGIMRKKEQRSNRLSKKGFATNSIRNSIRDSIERVSFTEMPESDSKKSINIKKIGESPSKKTKLGFSGNYRISIKEIASGIKRKTFILNEDEKINTDDSKKGFFLSPERLARNLLEPLKPSLMQKKSEKNLRVARKFKDIVTKIKKNVKIKKVLDMNPVNKILRKMPSLRVSQESRLGSRQNSNELDPNIEKKQKENDFDLDLEKEFELLRDGDQNTTQRIPSASRKNLDENNHSFTNRRGNFSSKRNENYEESDEEGEEESENNDYYPDEEESEEEQKNYSPKKNRILRDIGLEDLSPSSPSAKRRDFNSSEGKRFGSGYSSSFNSFKKKTDAKNLESQIFYDEANASTRKHKFGKQYSLNTLKEDAKTKKSSFGYLAENFNLRDLKNQIEEKILNIGQEADKETQYKIFLYQQRKKQLETLASQIESNIEDNIFAEADCQDELRSFLETRAKFHKEKEKKFHTLKFSSQIISKARGSINSFTCDLKDENEYETLMRFLRISDEELTSEERHHKFEVQTKMLRLLRNFISSRNSEVKQTNNLGGFDQKLLQEKTNDNIFEELNKENLEYKNGKTKIFESGDTCNDKMNSALEKFERIENGLRRMRKEEKGRYESLIEKMRRVREKKALALPFWRRRRENLN